jgi:hypothetical protein
MLKFSPHIHTVVIHKLRTITHYTGQITTTPTAATLCTNTVCIATCHNCFYYYGLTVLDFALIANTHGLGFGALLEE